MPRPSVEERLMLNPNIKVKWSRSREKRDTDLGRAISKRVRRGAAPVVEHRLNTFITWHPDLEGYLLNFYAKNL